MLLNGDSYGDGSEPSIDILAAALRRRLRKVK